MKPSPRARPPLLLLFLFAVSGFSGLAYQSLWTYYLGLTLGHAAYAQALCIAVYMGGMAMGAWGVSRISATLRAPLAAYAGVEIAIGLLALVFHGAFLGVQALSHDYVLPHLSGASATTYQWLVSCVLLLPQSILLGATFPLLAAGARRRWRGKDHAVIGWLYATNCLGAVAGVLITSFVLLEWIGVPGALGLAGMLNIAVGLATAVFYRDENPSPAADLAEITLPLPDPMPLSPAWALGVIALTTGATSFAYEIIWIRLLSQALGTTVHAFEIMLAAFILGLALGALSIGRGRASGHGFQLAHAQFWMGICALVSSVLLVQAYQGADILLTQLRAAGLGYAWFNLGSAAIAVVVMLPTAFFAGMTLPLLTLMLLGQGHHERVIGRVYALNTLGAIIGVMLTLHVVIPWLGLRHGLILAATIDALVGCWCWYRLRRPAWPWLVGLALAVAATAWLNRVDVSTNAAAFRMNTGAHEEGLAVPFARDGKTASITVALFDDSISIATNRKVDASMTQALASHPTPDEPTMHLLAATSLAAHLHPRRVAVIGWGSGLTTHTLLGSTAVQRVDTIEIEPAMVEGAKLFGARVSRAYADPRSHLVLEDARTYFSSAPAHYDVIISEPSNPWVSGVAGLFTAEFYALLRENLTQNGVLAQWLHTYSLNDDLLARMVAAQLQVFPNTYLFVASQSDLVLFSRATPTAPHWADPIGQTPALATELARVGMRSAEDIQAMTLAGPVQLATFVHLKRAPVHHDFFPIIALRAPRARFDEDSADDLLRQLQSGFPVREMFDGFQSRQPNPSVDPAGPKVFAQALLAPQEVNVAALPRPQQPVASGLLALQRLSAKPVPPDQVALWSDLATRAYLETAAGVDQPTRARLWDTQAWLSLPSQPSTVRALAALLRASNNREPQKMAALGQALLDEHQDLAPAARERVYILALLGHVGARNCEGAKSLVLRSANMATSPDTESVRRMVLQWANDCPVPRNPVQVAR